MTTRRSSDEAALVPARKTGAMAADTPAVKDWAAELVAGARAEGVDTAGLLPRTTFRASSQRSACPVAPVVSAPGAYPRGPYGDGRSGLARSVHGAEVGAVLRRDLLREFVVRVGFELSVASDLEVPAGVGEIEDEEATSRVSLQVLDLLAACIQRQPDVATVDEEPDLAELRVAVRPDGGERGDVGVEEVAVGIRKGRHGTSGADGVVALSDSQPARHGCRPRPALAGIRGPLMPFKRRQTGAPRYADLRSPNPVGSVVPQASLNASPGGSQGASAADRRLARVGSTDELEQARRVAQLPVEIVAGVALRPNPQSGDPDVSYRCRAVADDVCSPEEVGPSPIAVGTRRREPPCRRPAAALDLTDCLRK
jgi:hypothetical protein